MAALVPVAEGSAIATTSGQEGAMTVPADIAARLSEEQLGRLQQILSARTKSHPVDYRISTSMFGRCFYVALFAGYEARSWQRLNRENQSRPLTSVLRDAFAVSLAVTLMLCMLAGASVLGLFLLQPLTGFVLFPR